MCSIPPNFKWSFSKLSAFDGCREMFRLQFIDHIPQDGNAFSDYGSFCHKLLEEWAKGELPAIAMAEEYEAGYDNAVTHSFPPFPKGMPQRYYDAGLAYFESFDGFGDEWEILSAEEKFEISIGGYPFVGIADLILKNKNDGSIWVIDHKSKSGTSMTKELSTYRRQLYTYAAHVKEKYGVFPAKLSFNMFKEGTWIHEDFDMRMYEDTMKWVVETIESILLETEWKPCPSSYFCRFICGVLDSCPAHDDVLNPPPKGKKARNNEPD